MLKDMPTEMKEQLEEAITAATHAAEQRADEEPLVPGNQAPASAEPVVPIAEAASQGATQPAASKDATQLDEVTAPAIPSSWNTEQNLEAMVEAALEVDGAAAAPTNEAAGAGDLDAKAGGRGARKKGGSVAPEKATAKRQKKGN